MSTTLDFEGLPAGDFTEKLKCVICTNLLSIFPVYIKKNEGNICGRCYDTISDKTDYVFNEAFEALAQFVLFPCRYVKSGCLEKYQPLGMADHEKDCPYQTIKCPTHEFSECTWKEALPTALHHCQDKHFDMMLKNGEFDMNLTQSHECYNLLEYNSSLFVISRKFNADHKLLQFSIWHVSAKKDEKNYPCEVRFRSSNRSVTLHCKTADFHDKQVTNIYLDSLKNDDDDLSVIHCTVDLGETKENQNTGANSNREIINLEFLSLLKCSACLNYALPPIYQNMSLTGRNEIKCHECKTGTTATSSNNDTSKNISFNTTIFNNKTSKNVYKVTTISGNPSKTVGTFGTNSNTSGASLFGTPAPSAQATGFQFVSGNQNPSFNFSTLTGNPQPSFGNGGNSDNFVRNTKLEHFAELLTYPCKYEKKGCTFIAKSTAMKDHQEFCLYGEYLCVMAEYTNCAWFSLGKDMMTHIEEAHKDKFRAMSSEICQKISTNITTTNKSGCPCLYYCYIIKFSDKLFQVNFTETQQTCYWSVHSIGRTQGQFMYELEIIDANKIKRLAVKQMCTSWKKKDQLFEHVNDYATVNKTQLSTFLDKDQTFIFKITIFKV